MPTWASAPISSSARISSAVVTPPAMVTRQPLPAASTTALASSRLVPPMRPSSSTKVTRKPADMRLQLGDPLQDAAAGPCCQPSTTTSPCRASRAAITRSRGSRERISGLAAVPRMTLRGTQVEPARSRSRRRGCRRRPGRRSGAAGPRSARRCCPCAWRRRGRSPRSRRRARSARRSGRVAGVDRLLGAADELDGLAALEVDAGDDHGRTRMPCSCR